MIFRVELSRRALDSLEKLDAQIRERVAGKLKELEGTPFPRGCRKLKGEVAAYRLRVGKIRVLYKILWDEKAIVIFKIEFRESAYQ
jgi:mRNA-degrading endonuclease RelE of RelBE toxin-antitoxin system